MNYKNLDTSKLNYVIYCRKSSEGEDKQVQSLETQLRELKEHSERNKLNIVDIISESKSAFKTGREGFNKMTSLIRTGKANAILVIRGNRISRNSIDAGYIISLMDEKKLLYIRTPNSTCYTSSSTDKMMIALELIFSKKDSDDKGDMVKEGQRTKALKGYPHGLASLGFLNDKSEEKGNRKWMVDKHRLSVVKEMLKMFLSGAYSGTQVYDWVVHSAKLTTPKHKKSGGNFITYSRVYEILKDPIYAGFFYQQGLRYELSKSLPRLISEDEHNKILYMLKSRTLPKTQTHQTPYSGFIKSPFGEFVGADMKFQIICQCKYKFAYQNKTHCPKCAIEIDQIENPKYLSYAYYYNVPKRKKRESVKYIEEGEITRFFCLYVKKNLTMSKSLIEWSKRCIKEIKDNEVMSGLLEFNGKKERIDQLEDRKRKYRQMLASDQITNIEYKTDIGEMDKEISDLNNQKAINKNWYEIAEQIIDLTGELEETLQSGLVKNKRIVLAKLGSNLIWNEEILDIINTKPIQKLIDGLNQAKAKNPKFEPESIIDTSERNEVFKDVCPTLLPR
ncbi:MAG: recombinase family protein [Candidatus Paceibacterota bacterium]